MTAIPVVDNVPAAGARPRGGLVRAFARRRLALVGAVVAVVFIVFAIAAPLVAPHDPDATDFANVLGGSSWSHPLGTDDLGRDMLSRIIWGARASLEAGVLATAIAMAIAVPLGLVAGYYRGWWDPVISRITDVLLAFPFLVLAVGLAAIFGASLLNATLALGISAIPGIVRVTRAQALSLRGQEFVRAAVVNGAGSLTILRRHLLPNMASALLVQATVTIPQAIIGESLLSFLGLGVQPPTPSWGAMLSSAQPFILLDAKLAIFPGIAIALATLSFNLLGDGLRDVLDPRTRS